MCTLSLKARYALGLGTKLSRRICIYLASKADILCKICFVSFAFEFEMQTSFLFTPSSVIHEHIDTSIKAIVTQSVWGLFQSNLKIPYYFSSMVIEGLKYFFCNAVVSPEIPIKSKFLGFFFLYYGCSALFRQNDLLFAA